MKLGISRLLLALLSMILASTVYAQDEKPPANIRNAYPELPVLDFERTKVSLEEVEAHIQKTKFGRNVKIAGFVIFRMESRHGEMGINNNYIGYQADGHRLKPEWDKYFSGTVLRRELMTGKWRRFLAFRKWEDCLDILLMRINERGVYVGGTMSLVLSGEKIETKEEWPDAYRKEWVMGNKNAVLPPNEKKGLLRLYSDAEKRF